MRSLLLSLLLFRILVLVRSGDICSSYLTNYDGFFEFLSGPSGFALGPPLRMSVQFSYSDETIHVDLLDKEFEDSSYDVRHEFRYKEHDPVDNYACCAGFCPGGIDCQFPSTTQEKPNGYSFSLCSRAAPGSNAKQCEVLFEAEIVGAYMYPDIGATWLTNECSTTMKFSDGNQPPYMNYCVCCDSYNSQTGSLCQGKVRKDVSSTSTSTPSTSLSTTPSFSSPTTSIGSTHSTSLLSSTTTMKGQTTRTHLISTTTNKVVVVSTTEPYEIDCHDPQNPMEQVYCSNQTLTNQTVTNYIAQTQQAIDSTAQLNASDVYMLSHILLKISEVKDIKLEGCTNVYGLYDDTLKIPAVHFRTANSFDSSQRILESVERFLNNAQHNLELLDGSSLGMRKRHDSSACPQGGTTEGLGDFGDSFGPLGQQKQPAASIEIPADVACADGQTVPLYLVAYRKTQLFLPPAHPADRTKRSTDFRLGLTEIRRMGRFAQEQDEVQDVSGDRCRVGMLPEGRPVVSAVVLHNTTGKARVQFATKDAKHPLHGTHEISWWTGDGWSSTDKCTITQKDGMFVAECPHLTDFTLLVDGSATDPALCSTGLLILGNFLVIASAMCLLLMVLIQYANLSKMVRVRMAKLFLNFPSMRFRVELLTFVYTTSLFFFYLFFGVFSDSRRAFGQFGCSLFAALSYYLLLCCIFLTFFQAWRVLKLFAWTSAMDRVLSFATHNAVILLTSFAAPLLLSLIAYIVDNAFYRRGDNFCWIRAADVVWAVIVPTSLLVLNGLICLFVITVRLFPKAGCCSPIRRLIRTDTNTLTKGNRLKARDKLLAILNMQFLLGVPWALQYLSLFSPQATVWHWLFTIVNGSQGIILFVLFVVRRSRSRATRINGLDESQTQSKRLNETITTSNGDTRTSNSSEVTQRIPPPPTRPPPPAPVPHRTQGLSRPQQQNGVPKRRSRPPSNAWRISHTYDSPIEKM